MSSIHTNIRVLREEARLSQEEFAEQLNVDVQTVKLWEKGKIDPSDDEITKMCPILRIHKEDFLERDILAERTNANSKMKRGQHRSNYDWYYGKSQCYKYVGIEELDGYALRELVSAIYVDAPDKSSGKRVQHIHIQYDGLGFIPLNELMKEETA